MGNGIFMLEKVCLGIQATPFNACVLFVVLFVLMWISGTLGVGSPLGAAT